MSRIPAHTLGSAPESVRDELAALKQQGNQWTPAISGTATDTVCGWKGQAGC